MENNKKLAEQNKQLISALQGLIKRGESIEGGDNFRFRHSHEHRAAREILETINK